MNTLQQNISASDRLSAIADQTRLRLCRVLEKAELSVGEVARVLQMPQSTVSRHLKTLRSADWIRSRAEGTATLYRFILDELPEASRSVWMSIREEAAPRADLDQDDRRLESVLHARRHNSQSYFGRVAGEWDDIRSQLFGNGFTSAGLLALLPPDWIVADLGCGTGNAAELLSRHVDRVIAIDQSEPMLEAARLRLSGCGNVECRVGDLSDLPLPDRSVDATTCVLVLHHIADPGEAIREMARVLKPGGTALVLDMLEHTHEDYRHTMGHTHLGFDPNRLGRSFLDAGFRSFRSVQLPGLPEARGPGLFTLTARF
ncbi:MAG: ArsR/SmtB family transcription factor [Phycisphaerales bacterium]